MSVRLLWRRLVVRWRIAAPLAGCCALPLASGTGLPCLTWSPLPVRATIPVGPTAIAIGVRSTTRRVSIANYGDGSIVSVLQD